jgi:hypothetical protein
MNLNVVLIDETNGATPASGEKLTPDLLDLASQILSIYMNLHVAPYWGGQHICRAAKSSADVQSGEVPSVTKPTMAEAPGAIAYHTVDGYGIPAMVDAITLSDDLFGPNGWLSAQSHECAETIVDPGTNTLRSDGSGRLYAQEACDPLEVQTYPITINADGTVRDVPNTTPGLAADGSFTAYVANFVLDAYFTPGHEGPFDFLTAQGKQPAGQQGPAGPFTLVPAGGGDYQIVETDPQDESQITAAHVATATTDHALAAAAQATPSFGLGHATSKSPHLGVFGNLNRRAAKKAHPSSRAYRRGLRLGASQPT